jgi:two-component system, OmpR family, phosphate regulon response regulator OmpR
MPERPRICLLMTDRPRRLALAEALCRHGQDVTPLAEPDELQRLPQPPDVVVLDSLAALQRLRGHDRRLPVILAATADDELERILALELGADDCLRPPLSGRELLARVQAVLRRHVRPPPAEPAPVPVGAWTFDAGARCLRRTGQTRLLRSVEYALLAALTAHPGQVLARERLVAQWRARPEAVLPRSVDAAVMRLRKLVEPEPAAPRHIRTVRGHGYLFVP